MWSAQDVYSLALSREKLLPSALEGRWRQWHPTPVLLPGESQGRRSLAGCSPWGREESTRLSDFTFTFHLPALEKEAATHSSVLVRRIPGMAEPAGLPSTGSHRVRHDYSDLAAAAAALEGPWTWDEWMNLASCVYPEIICNMCGHLWTFCLMKGSRHFIRLLKGFMIP